MSKVALIIGITGQDGCYLSKLLLEKGYEVVGTSRGKTGRGAEGLSRLAINDQVVLRYLNPQDTQELEVCMRETQPEEIYNLAGETSVALSFNSPRIAIQSNINITVNCLELIRDVDPEIKYYNAATSECFGDTGDIAADEETQFRPVSPYGASKSFAYALTQVYRNTYGLFACSGILFNHESPLRSDHFVSKKIVNGARAIAKGEQYRLVLGDLNVERDWGWAPEYVDAIYKIMHHRVADDYVVATGITRSLEEFVKLTFAHFNLDWKEWVQVSDRLRRPVEIQKSNGNPTKIVQELGWEAKMGLEDIVVALLNDELYAGYGNFH